MRDMCLALREGENEDNIECHAAVGLSIWTLEQKM